MKKILLMLFFAASFLLLAGAQGWAGEVDVLVGKLVEKGVLSPAEAQIIMDETKVQVAKDLAQAKSISAPEWSQRIKWGGDVRVRTQGDWGKTAQNQPQTTQPLNATDIREQRIRNRIRGRFYMEAKVNDFTYAGVRFAGGGTNPRSTNDTMQDYFSKWAAMFDQYYMRFEAPAELVRDYGQYFSDLKLWAGKFPIPFEYSELVWDSDTNPSGVALQYASPDIKTGILPDLNLYSNLGFFWLNEGANYNTDPLLFGYQVGAKTAVFGPFDSVVNVATSFYDFANLQGKTPTVTANTNSRTWAGDYGYSMNPSSLGTYKYEYQIFDLLLTLDNAKVMDIEFPHGLYADFIYNAGCHEDTLNKGALLGGYIGKKKLKEKGDWKARAEWRYIERDAIPDFMPDSDFYGFGTYTSALVRPNINGLPSEGGTNGRGINMALEYQLFKNTSLNLEYYWMEPISSSDKTNPWNELQFDVVTKF